ncbi:MAG: hypothetical protein GX907_02180 [Clostridiaceae bacterium]|nr:hypothetical protein [Clostridiaceae bacterium]
MYQNEKKQLDELLLRHNLHADCFDYREESEHFYQSMLNGLSGKNSAGLFMLPSYISVGETIPIDRPALIIDAGGTNIRVARTHFNSDLELVVEGFANYRMPGSETQVDSREFYRLVAEYLIPLLDMGEVSDLGFCFSYGTQIMPNRDGLVLALGKEVEVEGLIGTMLGEGIRVALRAAGRTEDLRISVLNDTVAALLAGLGIRQARNMDNCIGYILGTGTNMACMVSGEYFKLLPPQDRYTMAVNLESGCYIPRVRSEVDVELDAGTSIPGDHVFEKMVGGQYQGLFSLYLMRFVAENSDLLSAEYRAALAAVDTPPRTKYIDAALLYPYGDNYYAALCHDDRDRVMTRLIITEMYERIAKLVCIQLGGVLRLTGAGADPSRPAAVSADGSTFYKSHGFRYILERHIHETIYRHDGRYLEFIQAENPILTGSTLAAF